MTAVFTITSQTPTNYFLGLPIDPSLLQTANQAISNLTATLNNNFDCSPPQNNLIGILAPNSNQHVGLFDRINDRTPYTYSEPTLKSIASLASLFSNNLYYQLYNQIEAVAKVLQQVKITCSNIIIW